MQSADNSMLTELGKRLVGESLSDATLQRATEDTPDFAAATIRKRRRWFWFALQRAYPPVLAPCAARPAVPARPSPLTRRVSAQLSPGGAGFGTKDGRS